MQQLLACAQHHAHQSQQGRFAGWSARWPAASWLAATCSRQCQHSIVLGVFIPVLEVQKRWTGEINRDQSRTCVDNKDSSKKATLMIIGTVVVFTGGPRTMSNGVHTSPTARQLDHAIARKCREPIAAARQQRQLKSSSMWFHGEARLFPPSEIAVVAQAFAADPG